VAVIGAVALLAAACGDDDDDDDGAADTTASTAATSETTAGGGGTTAPPDDTTTTAGGGGGGGTDEVPSGSDLGPDNVASGEPVKWGYFNDGSTAAVDHSDDTVVAEALVEYWNNHQGGLGGRPIELVVCETNSDPAIATDCGNRFVEEGVVAVSTGTSGFSGETFAPVNAAGIPFFGVGVAVPDMLADGDTTFVLSNALAQSFAVGVSVAVREGADRVASLVYDTPATIAPMAFMQFAADAAGVVSAPVPIAPGTPDMLPQITAAMQDNPGVFNIIGDPAFCLVALRGLFEAGFEGTIVTHDYCIGPDIFEPLPIDRLQEIVVSATVAMGDDTDPDWQFYTAIMDEYASSTPEVSGVRGWTYQSLFAPWWGLRGIDGADISPESIAAEMNAQPETRLALGGGITILCDGTPFPPAPGFCTAQVLEARLNESIQLTGFEFLDVSLQMAAIGEGMLAG
jgi:branched-chain amino acid transport system substrate-binding protein